MRLGTKAFILALISMLLLAGCMFGDPPLPRVTADGNKVPVSQNSYCWGNKCADYVDAKSQLQEKTPVVVAPGTEMKVRYSGSNPKTLQANMQTEDGTFHEVDIRDGIIAAPSESGIYYYGVHGFWKRGSSTGTFKIEVKP